MYKVIGLDPNTIRIGKRVRTEMRELEGLIHSIRSDGQMQPINVCKLADGTYQLIAGERRVQACKALKIDVKAIVIEVDDSIDALWKQIIENVQRNDFTKLELGEGLLHYKELYEAKHPEAKHGFVGDRAKGIKAKTERADRFTRHIAEKLKIAETRVRESIQLARDLPDDVKAELRTISDARKRQRAEHKALSNLRKENRLKKFREQAKRRCISSVIPRIVLGDYAYVMKTYAANRVFFDVVITDPYYSLPWSHIEKTCRADMNAAPTWDDLDVGWVFNVAPLLAENSTVVVFTPIEAVGIYQEALYEVGLNYCGPICWWKTNPVPVHRPGGYISAFEIAIWATKGKPYFRDWENAGVEQAHNAFRSPICQGNERLNYKTQKPEAVIDRIVERHAQRGSHVLDPFMGTGTTVVCCARRGIQCTGIERDKEVFESARARIGL